MLFFIVSLLLSLIISGAVLAGLVKSLRINWERRNRRPVGYLTPVLLMAAFILLSAYLAAPRLLDSVSMITRDYETETVTLQKDHISWSSLDAKGRRFYFNQWAFKPEAGITYKITYTPHSRYIVDMVELLRP
jgi:predicted PurR-regulated permease PerM